MGELAGGCWSGLMKLWCKGCAYGPHSTSRAGVHAPHRRVLDDAAVLSILPCNVRRVYIGCWTYSDQPVIVGFGVCPYVSPGYFYSYRRICNVGSGQC